MMKWFLETKWIMNLLFGVQFLYFLFHATEGLMPLINPPYTSPLIPYYANYYTAIHAVALLLVSLTGLSGIILLFQKKKNGWVLTFAAILCLFVATAYYSIQDSAFLFGAEDICNSLAIVYLLSKHTRTTFNIQAVNYILPILLPLLFIILKGSALSLSMTIARLTG